MKLVNGLSVFVIICVTFAQEISNTNENPSQEGRDLRDYSNQDWKALDYFSPTTDTSGWISQYSTETEDQMPRRRRIRKRKRRPPVITSTEDDQTFEATTQSRKRPRPQRLDQIRPPWEDMNEEINPRSYSRRRLTPVYEEELAESKTKNPAYEKIRDPFTALQEEEEKQKKRTEETPDLKTLLKQTGRMSLSEVLQQKNLSLAELLKGDQHAISALVRKTETTTETITSTESAKYRRVPPSSVMKRNFNRNDEESDDGLTSREVLEAQRKRLALLHGHKETKMFSDVTKYDVVTEETTEKRIFVPSNSKFYTSVDYKPDVVFKDITTIPESTISTTMKVVSARSRTRELPLTSAKMNKLVAKLPQEAGIPEKAVTININEIFGFSVVDKKNDTEMSDGPFKMTIDLGEIATTETTQEENVIQTETLAPVQIAEEVKITTAASVGEKLKRVTAKEEIMEILKNPFDKEYLSNILRTRNMTVEELVEQRERGSSQLHLADIFHNKTREPEPKDEPFIGHINSANFNSFPFFNRKSKSRTVPVTTTEHPATKPALQIDKEVITTKPPYTITSFPTFKIETNKNFKSQPFLPVWKQLYPSFFTNVYENNRYEDHTEFMRTTTATPTRKMKYDLESLEDIENTLAEAANGKHNLHQSMYDDNEFISLPSGVKSAILASLAIIGLSLLVFLTILVVFKWTQKQKRRLNYNGSFSGSKIKSPILEPDQKRSFKTFMTETLGRKKNYYKAHLQRMSDNMWDESEKKSYMI